MTLALLGAGILASSWAQAQKEGWPVEIRVPAGQIIIYQRNSQGTQPVYG